MEIIKQKFSEMVRGTNFYVTIVGAVLGFLTYNNITVPENMDAETIVSLFSGKTLKTALPIVLLYFGNVIWKVAQQLIQKKPMFGFIYSSNFWVQFGSSLVVILSPILGPHEAIVTFLIMNGANFVGHTLTKPKGG